MTSAATNIVHLAQYREQRARKSMRVRPSGAYMMCWVMFVPMLVPAGLGVAKRA